MARLAASNEANDTRHGPLLRRTPLRMLAVALSAAAVWGVWLASGGSSKARPAPSRAAQWPSASPSDLDKDRAIAVLTARVNALERRLAASTAARPGDDSNGSTQAEGAVDRSVDRAAQEARMVEYERALGDRAAAEAADPVWSSQIAAGVEERNGELAAPVAVESVRCGATLCTIVITHETSTTHASLLQALINPADVAPGFGGPAVVRRHPRPEGGYRTTMFIARPGARLPDAMPLTDSQAVAATTEHETTR